MHKDTIVGIAGAAILVAAMAGVFWYEGTRGAETQGARSFSVSFAEAPVNGPSKTGTANVGTPVVETFKIAQGNLTKITFTLVWTDESTPNNQPDTFTLKVEPPNGTTIEAQESDPVANGAGAPGEIALTFTIGTLPSATTVSADTASQAQDRAMSQSARSLGLGDWKITVTLTQAGDPTPVALPGGLPVNPVDDAANGWEIKTILTTFAATAE